MTNETEDPRKDPVPSSSWFRGRPLQRKVLSLTSVFRQIPGAPLLTLSAIFVRLGYSMMPLALILVVEHATGGFKYAGMVVAGFGLSSGVAAPWKGRAVDRYGRSLLAIQFVVTVLALIGLTVLTSLPNPNGPFLIALGGSVGLVMPQFSAMVRTEWATRCHAFAVPSAPLLSLDATIEEATYLVGPAVVSVVAGLTSPFKSLVLVLAVFSIGSILCLSVYSGKTAASTPIPSVDESLPTSIRGNLYALSLVVFFMGAMIGFIGIGLPELAFRLHSPSLSGPLITLFTAGSVIGGLIIPLIPSSGSVRKLSQLAFLMLFCSLPLVFANSIWTLAVSALIAGVPVVALFSSVYSQLDLSGIATNEGFSWIGGANNVGVAAGAGVAGVLSESMHGHAPFVFASAVSLLGLLWAVVIDIRNPSGSQLPEISET